MASPAKKTLQVCIESAAMLPNVDGFLAGKSDPYVICCIPGKSKAKMQTPTIQDNLNPVWNHTDMIHDYAPEDTLQFQVWDKNNFPMPDKKIGDVSLHPADFAANPYGMEGQLPLENCKAESATISFKVHVLEGEVPPTEAAPAAAVAQPTPAAVVPAAAAAAPAAEPMSKLQVEIISARMLPNKDAMLTGKSDPYVIASVPGTGGMFTGKTKIQTPVISNDLNPTWNFTGEIPHFKATDSLEFEVWDKDNFPKPDQLLGKTSLSPAEFQANSEGLEGELPLTGTKGEDAGTLVIRVHVLPDDGSAPVAHGPNQPIPLGTPYHGGILVNEQWHPPVLAGQVPGMMQHVALPTMVHGAPMPVTMHGPPMATFHAPAPVMSMGQVPMMMH